MPSTIWTNSPSVGRTYEQDQAERIAWFNKIAPSPNWKAPINAWVKLGEFDDCNEAAIFFTGSPLTKLNYRGDASGVEVFVTAPGYYRTIGA